MTFDHTGSYYRQKCVECGKETNRGAYCQKCYKLLKETGNCKRLNKFFNSEKSK